MRKVKYTLEQLEEILDNVRVSTLMHCTKNGEIVSSLAEEYLRWINKYAKHCIPEMAEEWCLENRKVVYSPLVPNLDCKDDPRVKELIIRNNWKITDTLDSFIFAGELMEVYANTHSFEEVDKLLREQGHSGWSFSGVVNVMLKYSMIGVQFVDRYYPGKRNIDKDFRELYNERKNYFQQRDELNQRFVYVLSNKKRNDIN